MSALTPAQLLALVNAEITANGHGAITGPVLNNILIQMIDTFTPSLTFSEPISVTAENTLANLSNTPSASTMYLLVNGQILFSGSPSPSFSFNGMELTWSASNAGFSLETTDKVVALYSY